MLPTVAQVLALEVVRRGGPRIVAGAGRLETPVRWVHAIELPDAARLLRGGELVLTTGIALPGREEELAGYAAELAQAGVSGVAVELGRRYTGGLPPALVGAAEAHDLPLIVFTKEIPFIEITEAVHALIVGEQLDQLRTAARMHEVFTSLAVAGATPGEIVQQAALLAGKPVILADLSHHVLAVEAAGTDPARLLDGFAARSRAIATAARTAYDAAPGWLVTVVGARGEDWGRLILACGAPPTPAETVLVERAATTLALARLLTRQAESLERQAHSTLIGSIMAQAGGGPEEIAARARALGVPVTGRQLLCLVVAAPGGGHGLPAQARVLQIADALADACRNEHVPALVGSLGEAEAGAVLSVDARAGAGAVLTRVCEAARQRLAQAMGAGAAPLPGAPGHPVIGVGSPASGMGEVRRSLTEAAQVAAAAAPAAPAPGRRPYYRLADLRLRGLLQLLGGDARLETFVARELGALLAYDAAHGTALTGLLAAYLAEGGNKAATAARAHLARPTLYERLARIGRILGVSLDSGESRTSLHVAMLAWEARQGEGAGQPAYWS